MSGDKEEHYKEWQARWRCLTSGDPAYVNLNTFHSIPKEAKPVAVLGVRRVKTWCAWGGHAVERPSGRGVRSGEARGGEKSSHKVQGLGLRRFLGFLLLFDANRSKDWSPHFAGACHVDSAKCCADSFCQAWRQDCIDKTGCIFDSGGSHCRTFCTHTSRRCTCPTKHHSHPLRESDKSYACELRGF